MDGNGNKKLQKNIMKDKYTKKISLVTVCGILFFAHSISSIKAASVIVRYNDSIPKEEANTLTAQSELMRVTQTLPLHNIALIESDELSPLQMKKALENDANIQEIEENLLRTPHFTPNDPDFEEQWGLHNEGYTINNKTGSPDADVDAQELWSIENPHAEAIVGIIDDGIDYLIPDLKQNLWDGSAGCIKWDGTIISAGCPNHGYDFERDAVDPYGERHGGLVMSTINAEFGNNIGLAGSSRYNNNKVMGLKFNYTLFEELKAITFAQLNGARVINMSFGGYIESDIEREVFKGFDGTIIASAGNDGVNIDNEPRFPCGYNLPNVICVGSTNNRDDRSRFSNYGTKYVDLAAPGEDIYSYYDGALNHFNGTSFSSPFVSAAAATLYGHNSHLTPEEVTALILSNVDRPIQLSDSFTTNGRLNTHRALQALKDKHGIRLDPYRYNGIQNEDLVSTNDNYTFAITTSKHANCSTSTTKNTDYTAMTPMDTTGGTAHLHTISGLSPNTVYSYYIRCSDHFGNTNTTDYTVQFSTQKQIQKPVYRFYNSGYGSHFYTTSIGERDYIITKDPGWKYEGVAYTIRNAEKSSFLKPVYRFYSPSYKSHFYTISLAERNTIIANDPNWTYEGIAYEAYENAGNNRTKVFRFYNPQSKSHFFSTSHEEAAYLSVFDKNWVYEGVAYYFD